MNGAIHIRGGKIKLRSRPWHFKLRPNVADHLVARYNAGIFLHMPGGLEAMPLPKPRNMRRLNSLATSSIAGDTSTKGSPSIKGRQSQGRTLENVSPTEAEEELAQVGGPSAYGASGAVYNKANDAVQEARGVTDALHLTKPKSDGLLGRSFRKLKRDSGGSDQSSSGGWTMWHMFGCVAMQKGVKDESSSSDEDESIHAVPSTHSRSGRVN